ncbi:MAG: TetR/AcrR family transcriptional regulator [Spirochaetales bacterium]|nr:TetR/AcrR family transcriptional regulator [Spirochaetales bacterium]
MKRTFENLSREKQNAIIDACIREFGEHGYEKATTDRIIKRIGISKGGLYEYVSSKKELYLFIVEYTYGKLYDYLRKRISNQKETFSSDILERVFLVSSYAIDFYVEHPEFVSLITKTYGIEDSDIYESIVKYFKDQFLDIFGSADESSLKYEMSKIIELIMWLLLKTRQDFLLEIESNKDIRIVKKNYMDNWKFYISILKNGIYKKI